MPSTPRARQGSHLLVSNYVRRGVDIQWVVGEDNSFLPVVDHRNILQAVGALPSLDYRVDDIRTARLGRRNPRSVDMGQDGLEVAVIHSPSSRKARRRSGLVEGR